MRGERLATPPGGAERPDGALTLDAPRDERREPGRLSAEVAATLDDPEHQIWLSPITTWECLVLAARGRVRLDPDPETWVRRELGRLGFTEAPLNHEVAMVSRSLELDQADPADRFLAATAAVHDLTLVTADQRLLAGRGYSVLANR